MISLKTHNILDYVIGAVLIACPYLFGFSAIDAARSLFVVLGVGLIAYSMLTDYRYSVLKVIPLGVHMTLDVLAGIVLIFAPYVFGYNELITGSQTVLHFVLGGAVCVLVAMTQPKSEQGRIDAGKSDEFRRDDIDRRAA